VPGGNADSYIHFPDGWDRESVEASATTENDRLESVDWFSRGYSVLEFTRDGADAESQGGGYDSLYGV